MIISTQINTILCIVTNILIIINVYCNKYIFQFNLEYLVYTGFPGFRTLFSYIIITIVSYVWYLHFMMTTPGQNECLLIFKFWEES